MNPPAEDEHTIEAVAQLVHELRQPLSTLVLLVDNAKQLDLPDGAGAMVEQIAEQVAEAVTVARKISRLVE